MSDAEFVDRAIKAYGSAKLLAEAVGARTLPITQSAVYQWKRRGIAPKLRATLADVAAAKGVQTPKGFLDPDSKPQPRKLSAKRRNGRHAR